MAHPLKPLDVAVVNPIQDHQVVARIRLGIPCPFRPKQHLHRELVLQEIDVVDVGDVGTNPKRRALRLHHLRRDRSPFDRGGLLVHSGLPAPSQLREGKRENAGQSDPEKPPCPTPGPHPHA